MAQNEEDRSRRRYSEEEDEREPNRGRAERDDDIRGQRRRPVEPDDDTPKSLKSKAQPLAVVVLAVVLSVLSVMMWANTSLLSKADFETNVANILEDIGKMQGDVNAIEGVVGSINALNAQISQTSDKINATNTEVASVKSSISGFIKADSLTGINSNLTAIQNSVNSLKTDVNNVKSSVSTLSTSVATLKTQLAASDARILVLEHGGVGGITPSKAIVVAVKTLGNNALSPVDLWHHDANQNWVIGSETPTIYDGLQGSMRVMLQNTTLVDIDDVTVNLGFEIYPSMVYYTPTLTGGGVPWHKEYSDSQFIAFYNGAWGLSVPAGETTTLTLTLTIQGINDNANWNRAGGYYYQLDADAS